MSSDELVECTFLVPLVRDSDRGPHRSSAWRSLHDALNVEFGGYSGLEQIFVVYRAGRRVLGTYRSETSGRVADESRRYIVAVRRDQLDGLRGVLRQATNTFDREALYVSVAGIVEFVSSTEEDGYLP